MSANSGTLVLGPIRPFDSADTYPTALAKEVKGGLYSVANTTERDAIFAPRREQGMLAFDYGTNSLYKLGSDLTTWTSVIFGGSGNLSGTLTPGYVPYATGTNALANSNLSCKPYNYDSSDDITHSLNASGAYLTDSIIAGNANSYATQIVKGNASSVNLTAFGSNWGSYFGGNTYGVSMNNLINLGALSGGSGFLISQDGNNPIYLGTNGVIAATLTGSGYFGFGTTTPNSQLTVFGNAGTGLPVLGLGALFLQDPTGTVGSGCSILFGGKNSANTFAGIKGSLTSASTQTKGDLSFYTRNSITDIDLTKRMTLTSGGLLEIGGKLSVGGFYTPLAIADILQPDSSTFSLLARFAGNNNSGFIKLPSTDAMFGLLTSSSNGCTANRMISCSSTANPSLSIEGTTASSPYYPVINFDASKQSGTSSASIANGDMGWAFSNNGSPKLKIYGNGDLVCGNITGNNLTLYGAISGDLSVAGRTKTYNFRNVTYNTPTQTGDFSGAQLGDVAFCACDAGSPYSWTFIAGGVGELDPGHVGVLIYNGAAWVNPEIITP
jgi:hypothetical protein